MLAILNKQAVIIYWTTSIKLLAHIMFWRVDTDWSVQHQFYLRFHFLSQLLSWCRLEKLLATYCLKLSSNENSAIGLFAVVINNLKITRYWEGYIDISCFILFWENMWIGSSLIFSLLGDGIIPKSCLIGQYWESFCIH